MVMQQQGQLKFPRLAPRPHSLLDGELALRTFKNEMSYPLSNLLISGFLHANLRHQDLRQQER
jgi:hypothetical protein